MTDHPGRAEPVEPGADAVTDPPTSRRRVGRRAERPGTNPASDDAPDVVAPREGAPAGEAEHDRWLREQRPPHWE